jgi:hypothetical protein
VSEAEQQTALLGQQIVEEVQPDDGQPKLSAIDGRMYKAQGPKWHKSDRQKDIVPVGLRNVDTESEWSKRGYRGLVQGYRLVVQGLAFPHPVPVFAAWRPNNENEAEIAIEALLADKLKVTDVLLGDETFGGCLFPYLYEEARPKKSGGDLRQNNQFDQRLRSEFNTSADASSYRLGGASCEAISIFLI